MCWPQVDPTYILSEELAALTEEKCPEGALTPGCAGLNKTPVCEAIASDSIYGGERGWRLSAVATLLCPGLRWASRFDSC